MVEQEIKRSGDVLLRWIEFAPNLLPLLFKFLSQSTSANL